MNTLYDLKEMLDDQLKRITKKGDISPTELDNAYKAVDIIKDIETIDAMKNADYGYSQGYPMSYNDGHSMNYRGDGHSYARRGRDGDGDGRYSEARGRDARGRYTSRDGYSRGTMHEHLQEMLAQAQTEEERQAIRRCMNEING